MIKRELNLSKTNNLLLFGPRQVGKTTLIRESFPAENLQVINLLLSEVYTKYKSAPAVFREEVRALSPKITHVVVDEAQRVPDLLNEIQALIDEGIQKKFIITGSSARKLKRGQANLLGGRALNFGLYPLTFNEMAGPNDLSKILTYGTLPANVTAAEPAEIQERLRAYVDIYLKEEIELEALSRNIGGFIRFLSIAGQTNAEQLNFSNIGRDVGISSVTAKEYFKILEDTLIGTFLLPFEFSERKRHKTAPKFYFFDTGVLRAIQKKLSLPIQPNTFEFGNYYETWVINEVVRISSYLRKDLTLSFLRTASDVEVDLVIQTPAEKVIAVEIKSKPLPIGRDFEAGFKAIRAIVPTAECYCVCPANTARLVEDYRVIPHGEFFEMVRAL